ncbi:MAG: thioredoxin fold domain-containing protein [Sulfuricaulis sp.]|uniref:thioredoxin family protein n=1 Tax=Sulfuricaulis sp. TaxID=2003553 RepID=UPI0025D41988|nr:thioredoxin fold domain-containing protein [Sulfuricaulis sp.]MCR4347474.1 thioredoxin fold domain-containing protein [Sulfuricaulis sp.]
MLIRIVVAIISMTVFSLASAAGDEAPRGQLTGGQIYELPDWFKKSFLVLHEDVEEAKAQGRHVMLFMYLDECPYCARLLDENFRRGEAKDFAEKYFDVIAINIRGGNSVEWFDGKTNSETELARKLKVVATPTMVFFDATGKTVLQLNGYRKPAVLRQALDYVHGKHYQSQSLASYVEKLNKAAVYRFRPDARFTDMTDFKGYSKPLAVIFEDKDCADCDEFHAKVLNHAEVQPELAKYKIVRLDAYSDSAMVDIDGRKTTPRAWAQRLNLIYRPGVVFFNEGKERMRMDGMQYHFHFKELLRYVSGKHYHKHATFSSYNAARRDELLSQGVAIDYAQ